MIVIPVEAVGTYGVLLNITLSTTGSALCAVAPSNFSMENISDLEFYGNMMYYKANVPSVDLFLVTFQPNIEQRLFCRGRSIYDSPDSEATYISDPFYVSCMFFSVLVM